MHNLSLMVSRLSPLHPRQHCTAQQRQRAGATPTDNPTVELISGANNLLELGEPGDPARGIHNGYASLSMPLMPDHDERKLSVREMINAHLFPVLALAATASAISIAMSLAPVAGQAARWNKCYDAGLAWLERSSPSIKGGDRTAIAANFCNGGLPNRPAR